MTNDNNEMFMHLKAIRELQVMIDDLSAELEAHKDAVKNEMTSRNTDEIRSDIYCATWKKSKRTSLDQKALKSADPDTYNKYLKTTEVKTFRVA